MFISLEMDLIYESDFLQYYATLETSDDSVASIKEKFFSKVREENGEHWKDLEIYKELFEERAL